MPAEGKDTPKICLGFWAAVDEANMRRVKQIGVDHVLTGGPRIPWDEADIRARIDRFKAGGLTLCNMMISGFDDVIWGRPGADAQIAQRHRVDSRGGQGRPARHRIQLLREPADGGLQGGDGPRRRRLHRVRLRAVEEPAAARTASARTRAPSS